MKPTLSTQPVIVSTVQATLFDFQDGIPATGDVARARLYPTSDPTPSEVKSPKLALSASGIIEIARPSCPQCGRKLRKWGVNGRKIVLDKGHQPAVKGVQRYRCPVNREVPIDLSAWVHPGARYADNFRRRAWRLTFHGQTPAGVCQVFEDCFDVAPGKSTVRGWADQASEMAGRVIPSTKVPMSGFMGYDEIHVRVNGEKKFILTGADLHTGFVPPAEFSPVLGKAPVRQFLRQVKRVSSEKLAGLVADGTNEFGTLFQEPEFARVALQRCQTHYKKKLNENSEGFFLTFLTSELLL